MRTKALLCAAVFAAGVITTMAQVYSQNIVGYANVTVKSAWDVAANPFNNGANTADVVLPPTDNCQVLQWGGVGFATYLYDSGYGGWVDDGYNAVMPTIAPGAGFFYYNPDPNPITLTFVGNVAGNAGEGVNNPIAGGWQLISSKLPFSGAVDSASFNLPVQDNMQILIWGGVGYATVLYDSGYGGWVDDGYNGIPAPSMNIGQGFFYYNPDPAGSAWWQTVPANTP